MEIDRTDGFFLLFDNAPAAARYALACHEALADLALRARVGLHVGPVTLRDNDPADVARGAKPHDVEGLAKPFAARLMSLARAGQTRSAKAPARPWPAACRKAPAPPATVTTGSRAWPSRSRYSSSARRPARA